MDKTLVSNARVGQKVQLPLRFVVSHYHGQSARLRFLCGTSNGYHVCLPTKLPRLVALVDRPAGVPRPHPQPYFDQLKERFGIGPSVLQMVPNFAQWVETPQGTIPVYLARVAGPDPFSVERGWSWIELPECFPLSALERDLLRAVYEHFHLE